MERFAVWVRSRVETDRTARKLPDPGIYRSRAAARSNATYPQYYLHGWRRGRALDKVRHIFRIGIRISSPAYQIRSSSCVADQPLYESVPPREPEPGNPDWQAEQDCTDSDRDRAQQSRHDRRCDGNRAQAGSGKPGGPPVAETPEQATAERQWQAAKRDLTQRPRPRRDCRDHAFWPESYRRLRNDPGRKP